MRAEEVGQWISATLLSDSAVAALVGNKVFPLCTAEPQDVPWCVYTAVGVDYARTKDEEYPETVDFICVACSNTYSGSIALADAVRGALAGRHCEELDGDVETIRVEADFDPDAGYIQILTFIMRL